MAAISSFVPSEDIRKLTFGSYEHLKSQVESSIEASREKLFGSDAPVQVLGTFSGYAIVLSEDAKVFRVKFEKTEAGGVAPLSSEVLSVPAYKKETLGDFAMHEARAYVEAFMSGSKSVATEHMKNLVPVVKDRATSPQPARIVESFENLVKGERGWKKVYAAKIAEIRSTVREELPKLDENRMHDKFRRLYDGTMSSTELFSYKDLVTSDLNYLGEKIENLLSGTEKAVNVFKGSVPALKTEQKDPTVKMFESFSEDFVADLKGVKRALSEAADHLNGVDDFGKIYDLLANELYRYEVAGQFVAKMSRRLAEAVVTEER
jgi:hypothetical protein